MWHNWNPVKICFPSSFAFIPPPLFCAFWNMEVMANVLATGAFKQSQRWKLHTENRGAKLSTIIQSTTVLNKSLLDEWMK